MCHFSPLISLIILAKIPKPILNSTYFPKNIHILPKPTLNFSLFPSNFLPSHLTTTLKLCIPL
ncbi:hypothetical protein, partial [Campylobacter troglodytis]|uniref:hypothetical protein n=1 Tax=Campylobacter troglodytis TaxID=654363 RepID=UPI001C8E8AE0